MAGYSAYLNGEWVPLSQVKIGPGDRGFLVGDTVFDWGEDVQRQELPDLH